MTPQEWLTVILIGIGIFFKVVAAVGLTRMPDLYLRMHGAAKSATLGIVFIMLALAIHFATAAATMRVILFILFFFFTAPVAIHLLARAAYRNGVPRWEGTIFDEMEQYRKTHGPPSH